MLDTQIIASATEADIPTSERVDLPQSYSNWRDYAFSEAPETEPK
jgi:hypothetical protein